MKNKTYIKTAILSLMGGLVLLSSSCLKDNSHYVDYLADAPIAEFPLAEVNPYVAGGSDGAYQIVQPSSSSGTYTLTVAVKVAAPKALSTNTTFTISTTDLTSLNALNEEGANPLGTTMQPLPSSAFTIVGGNQVVVKSGTNTTYFNIKINESALDPLGTYALPLTITSADGILIAQAEKYLVYDFFTPSSGG